jgi:hypothetical protein
LTVATIVAPTLNEVLGLRVRTVLPSLQFLPPDTGTPLAVTVNAAAVDLVSMAVVNRTEIGEFVS